MTATVYQPSYLDISYNGWANYKTWNVALWLQNDESLYNISQKIIANGGSYADVAEVFSETFGLTNTPDGVKWDDPKVNIIQLNSELFDN